MIHEALPTTTETAFGSHPRRVFHGGNTGSNPVGDAKPFQELAANRRKFCRHKKAQLWLDFD
jgi:hypothetical protein